MPQADLRRLVGDAPAALCGILQAARGAVEAPIRSEIFGLQRFAEHGRSLGLTHRAANAQSRTATFFPRLRSNIETLRLAHNYIGVYAATGYDITPAAEWLLGNFHVIEAQLHEIHRGLPRNFFRALPVLLDEPLAGLPRIYGVAWAFVAHTDSAFDESLLVQFLNAYQEGRELNLAEMWALPTTLRVVLMENLRRLSMRVASNKAAREVANLCCDRIESMPMQQLDQVLEIVTGCGVGRVFLAQVAQRLQDRHGDTLAPVHAWLKAAIPDPVAAQAQHVADQAADNLSVSNAVTSLRSIGDADWTDIVSRSSALMRLMLTSPVFEAEHSRTRDQSLHDIERLARRSGRSELGVATALLEAMRKGDGSDRATSVPGHWLRGAGRPVLLQTLGLTEHVGIRVASAWSAVRRRLALPLYLGALLLGTASLVTWLVARHASLTDPAWLTLIGAMLMALPASEAVVAVINRLISESVPPQQLPRLALAGGIPAEQRVMVVIPSMLTDSLSTQRLVHRLLLHHLANRESHTQFALLTDWADADSARVDGDDGLLAEATRLITALNLRHPQLDGTTDAAPRFIVLHRERTFSPTEQRWIGWERKRGKLELLMAALSQGTSTAFIDLGRESRVAADTRHVLTLDSDTELPPGCLRELVGVAAHPHNAPQMDASGRIVVSGYAILQPRIVTPLPAPREMTHFHWLFAGQCGIDPYSAATSEVYQDLFSEGSFCGKGLLNVAAMHAALAGKLPEGLVLSHDLVEGALARCAVVTDIGLIEGAPSHADVAASRVQRWIRGDWQLLPILLNPWRYRLRTINRWKLFDNLRRSLVAPAALALLVLAMAGMVLSPAAALGLAFAAFAAGPLMGAIAAFSPSRDDIARKFFYRQAATGLARALAGALWHMAMLLQHAMLALDAIVRALYRMAISHRHLLQWTTTATAQRQASNDLAALARRHWRTPVAAFGLLAGLLAGLLGQGGPNPLPATLLCLLWAASPVATWWVSRPHRAHSEAAPAPADQAYMHAVARDTWRFFERCVGAEHNHLPPDNLQRLPHDMVANRTSPTNIGLYLLATACARQYGWIGTQDLLTRLDATLATMMSLQRHRGHFLNWYDTHTRAPLLPRYVSTVDSGNLCGHLLAVAQACLEFAQAPHDLVALRQGLLVSRRRLELLLTREPRPWPDAPALERLLALVDPIDDCQTDPVAFAELLQDAGLDLLARWPEPTGDSPLAAPGPDDELGWCLADHLATLRSACQDITGDASQAAQRLRALARDCEQLAWQADFAFLYHRKRQLLHIGYRVAEQQLDAGFYDLLASESRLTSLLAIAKGDVPVRHWAALGRPFFTLGANAGLRSWSGSMFEYLMPCLLLVEPRGSVLRDAGEVALREQVAFGKSRRVPWGMSESAYAGRDHTLAYQYAPQGVPRLALRLTPPDELVVAPYATGLAAMLQARLARGNFAALQDLAPRARYGFIEALDFSPAQQASGAVCTPVVTFMAHHQGMMIVALANVLLDGAAQRWGMANVQIEAVASLLHERAPREVTAWRAAPAGPPAQALRQRAPGLLREVLPGEAAVEPTHVLGNGRYRATLRANGAGSSQWGGVGITRERDDALRDALGSFCYLRWDRQPHLVSITQHPAPDPAAQYSSVFHTDRVCLDAAWPEVQAHMTAWVSPEDDIEFRQIELRNLSQRTLDIELVSAFEVSLAEPRADEAHPVFMGMFVRAEWQPAHQALVFERKPRLATEAGLHAAHFLAASDPQVIDVRAQTDRARWLGRNHGASRPLGACDELPATAEHAVDSRVALDTGLDPVCALAVRLRIAPQGKAELTFATAAADHGGTLHALMDKYRQARHVERASLMSATLTSIRLRNLRISPETFAAIQSLTTALVLTLARVHLGATASASLATPVCDRRLLWRLNISGDQPIILVTAGIWQGLGLLRSLAQALRLWSWAGIACDLVVVNAEPFSYTMDLQRELTLLRERHVADGGAGATRLHVLRADEVSADEMSTLRTLARVRLNADGRPLPRHVQDWIELHERAFEQRHASSTTALAVAGNANQAVPAPKGDFAASSGEFSFDVSTGLRPARPWVNVLSNPAFGTQLSEAGGGYTWAINSRLNQLTAWSNDPVADPPSEWILLQDARTREVWSVAPSACGDEGVAYHVVHGQGYSVISHRRGEIGVTATWCVDARSSVKQVRLELVNHGPRAQRLRVVGIAEWMMGANRSDRGSVQSAIFTQRLPGDLKLTALLCTQAERSGGFGDGTAFLALAADRSDESDDWTCDRRECFDARGRLVLPDHFGRRSGAGLDPCAALATHLLLGPGQSMETVFLLGYAQSPDAARQLATLAATTPAAQRLEESRAGWDSLLGATTVKTPDPLFDVMVNRWLLYQTVTCRLWSKAGFYQAGGATGFRDQLQDTMALTWAAPSMLREQILLCASRQFGEGDVQHWWHAPTGAGVRTHFSDDLLWLAHACVRYLSATGDVALLEVRVPFLAGPAIAEGAEDAYYTPTTSEEEGTIYEHAARSIDLSLRVGVNGLPLMGSGDWNDGMNRVGNEGRGESVWLGWFLCALVADFAPLARARGESERAQRWELAAHGWKVALNGAAWDGQWFKRAFFDDGQALGSGANSEARIDLVAQSWAVLSDAAQPALQRIALAAMDEHLVDQAAGLIRLLDPPLIHASPSAGYIQAYPPGVRENGGQYSHAAVWALMAQAEYARRNPGTEGAGDTAYRYFTYLSPAHRAQHATRGAVYGIEPYVVAGDVYSQAPYTGRGGWSWYTGAAAWLHRAAIESIFGLRLGPDVLSFNPCLPSHWPQVELTLRRAGRSMRFSLVSATPSDALEAAAPGREHAGARLLVRGQLLSWTDLPAHADFVIPLLDDIGDARGAVLHRVATRADR